MSTIVKGDLADVEKLVQQFSETSQVSVDGYEVQTDKDKVKIVGCTECGKPLAVNTFYAPARAKCSEHGGGGPTPSRTGSQSVVQAGRTNPDFAENMADALVNPGFANMRCPVHPDDDEHVMEIKSIVQTTNRGPGYLMGDGRYRQTAVGETVMGQCLACRATVTYSTTAMSQYKRANEKKIREATGGDTWAFTLGTR